MTIMSPSTETRENRVFAAETKFLVSPVQADQIRQWARSRLLADPNAAGETGDTYTTTSLYFDNPQFDMLHRRGSYGRCKYRIRRYGAGEVVFLERKLKARGLVTKRRTIVPIEEVRLLEQGEPLKHWAGYWFHRRLENRGFGCVWQISYFRTARVAPSKMGSIRMTLDSNVRVLPLDRPVFHAPGAGMPVDETRSILELKYFYSLPAVFKELIGEFRLVPHPVSKYRLAASTLGLLQPSGRELELEECCA
jgi:hypothetical protein